jgi:plasmid maintenance system antidote protein VapI
MSVGGLRATLEALGWSQTRLAVLLECDARTVRNWVAGVSPVPPEVQRWLDACVAHHRAHLEPAPPRLWAWRAEDQPSYLNSMQLAELLDAVGLSQQQLARLLGVHRASVARWFNGQRLMPAMIVEWLREVLRHRERWPMPPAPAPHVWKYLRTAEAS